MSQDLLDMLEKINSRLDSMEKTLAHVEEKTTLAIQILRNHLIRVKNHETINDNIIIQGRPYNDLSPQMAYKMYKDNNKDFLMLDVSKDGSPIINRPNECLHIPLEELAHRYFEIQSKTTPILIISEDGLRSIKACEFLAAREFYNLNNISGGYEYWPEKNDQTY